MKTYKEFLSESRNNDVTVKFQLSRYDHRKFGDMLDDGRLGADAEEDGRGGAEITLYGPKDVVDAFMKKHKSVIK